MEQVTVIDVDLATFNAALVEQEARLADMRHRVADVVGSSYGVMRDYALMLNSKFAFNWYEVEAHSQGDMAKAVHAEKKALFVELKKVAHSNPSTIWARVRKYGQEETLKAAMLKAKAEGAAEGEGEAEAEAEGEAGSRARSPMLRNMEELMNLYKFNLKSEIPAKVQEAQKHIIAALGALGVDVSKLA